MALPDFRGLKESNPGPYERQMGVYIVGLLRLFRGRVPDSESNTRVLELANSPSHWSAGHRLFKEIRPRLLAAMKAEDASRCAQHYFEESCLQAIYNATDPPDPFDPGSAFFVAGQAISLARVVGVPVESVVAILAPTD